VKLLKSYDANIRQLEIWKKTMEYEIQMMASQSVDACDDFVIRLLLFEQKLRDEMHHETKDRCQRMYHVE
jgi:hypothetical protein